MTLHAYDSGDVVPFPRRLAFMRSSRFSLRFLRSAWKNQITAVSFNWKHKTYSSFPHLLTPHRIFKKLEIDKSVQVCFFCRVKGCAWVVSNFDVAGSFWMEIRKGKCWRWNWHLSWQKQLLDGWVLMLFQFWQRSPEFSQLWWQQKWRHNLISSSKTVIFLNTACQWGQDLYGGLSITESTAVTPKNDASTQITRSP